MNVAATQDAYGRWAAAYDRLCRVLPGLDGLRSGAVDALALAPGDTAVDLGCGTGANLAHLRERVGPEGTVVGVDVTPGMLAQAARRVADAGWENVHLVQGDAARPPVEAADGVLATFLVGMLPDPSQAVERWTSDLAVDGRVVVLEATRTDRTALSPLNAAFDRLVAAGAPGDGRRPGSESADGASASLVLDERVTAARDALAREARLVRDDRHAGGFVRVFAGERD